MKKNALFAVLGGAVAVAGAALGIAYFTKKAQKEDVELIDLEILDEQLEEDAEAAAETVEEIIEDVPEEAVEEVLEETAETVEEPAAE